MYAVTSIVRSSETGRTKFCEEEASPLGVRVAQYRTSTPPSRDRILSLTDEDLIVRRDDCWRHYPRLVVFDMDSTLIEEECIDLLAHHAGVEDQVSRITARAMRGELDFAESLAARVALLEGLRAAEVFAKVRASITIAKGARDLCRALKRMGCRLALISGGFEPLARHVQQELGIDHMYANNLEEVDGKLTGRTYGPVVHAERKRELLIALQTEIGCRMEQVVAVGDGANDLPMLNTAGLGVAIHAKEKVQREAPARIRFAELDAILYLFGLTEGKVTDLCRP